MNVFNQLPPNSILITDYWDFYAPTYYLQIIEDTRTDLTIIDMSLLRYPWYLEQLAKRYPGLVQNSQDIAATFRTEQRKWVNGETFNSQLLTQSYFGLLDSFIDRNALQHPPYLLFAPCDSPGGCDSSQVAARYFRQPDGLVTRLWPQQPDKDQLPPEPNYDLRGITSNPVPMDDFAKANTRFYVDAYGTLARYYASLGDNEKAGRMNQKASEVASALQSR
jgi:hypothetical protein